MTTIGKIVKQIQFNTDPKLSIEQIAGKINISRTHLTRLIKSGKSKKTELALQKEFGHLLDGKKPSLLDSDLRKAVFNLTETNRMLVEVIDKLAGKNLKR